MDSDLPPEYLRSSLAQESQVPSSSPTPGGGAGSEQQLQEEDDLQLAIAMSLNEQENKSKKSPSVSTRHHNPSTPRSATPSAPPPAPSTLYASILHDTPTNPSYSGGGGVMSSTQQPPQQQQPEHSQDPVSLRTLYPLCVDPLPIFISACQVPGQNLLGAA